MIALGITSLFSDVASEMIFPLLPVFLTSLGASAAALGLIEGVANATAAGFKLASGYWADRMTRKRPLVLAGYAVAAAARPLVAFAGSAWQVMAVRFTDRIGKGVRSSPRDLLIANAVSHADSGRAFGFHQAMDHTGAVLGPLVATLLLGLGWPMRQVFLAALVPGVVSVLAVLVVRETPSDTPKPAADSGSAAPAVGKLPPRLRSYLGILTLFALGNSSDAFLLLRANAVGVTVAALPALWSLFHVSKVLSSYLGGGLSDRVSRPKLILLGWVVYALSYLGFGLAQHAWQCWALFVVYGTYYGLTEPVEKALVRDLAPSELRGRAYGYYNFTIGFSAIPAGLLTGYVWQTWSPLAAMCTGAGLACVASIALWLWNGNETLQTTSG